MTRSTAATTQDIAGSSSDRLGPYLVHPVAARFPRLIGEEFDRLVETIKQHGLQEPIVLDAAGTTIIDGINRYRACDKAGVEPVFKNLGEHYTEFDIINFIIMMNVTRRHLDVGQRALLAFEIAPALEAAAKQRQVEAGKKFGKGKVEQLVPKTAQANGRVRDQLAAQFNVGHSAIS
jgi:hypothetical protein